MDSRTLSLDSVVLQMQQKAPGFVPRVGVVLGSGLGAFGDTLHNLIKVPYAEVGLPQSHVVGHAGNLCLGTLGERNVPIACLQGRIHAYEGHSMQNVVAAVRALALWGCEAFVLTNAAGGVNPALEPGDLMLLRDHINLMGPGPLVGPNDDRFGPRFPDMSLVYDRELRALAHNVALQCGTQLREGVYCGLLGPAYETPAEIRMLRVLGADAVGMSTVPEAQALRHMGKRVVAISCVTNKGAGLTDGTLNHHEVQEVANRTRSVFVSLLRGLVSQL